MIIYEDTLQQHGKHILKHEWFKAHGVETVRLRFDGNHPPAPSFGDYFREGSNIVVDTKRNIDEIAKNINGREHVRFKNECQRAKADGYRLIVLVENLDGVSCIEDLMRWLNGHCCACIHYKQKRCDPRDSSTKCEKHATRKPIQGERLAKAMHTMTGRYGVCFMFCTPHESARIICELLGVMYEQDAESGA